MNKVQGWSLGLLISLVMWAILIGGTCALVGCQRGDIKVTPVVEGQAAPHDGWNIGPELWVQTGDEIKVTGAVIWVRGLDPNNVLYGE